MVYVKRDSAGSIIAVSQTRGTDCTEQVAADAVEVREFLQTLSGAGAPLEASDQDFVRVLEDVVELLIAKGVILFTELPDSARDKIMKRQRLRSEMSQALDLIKDD